MPTDTIITADLPDIEEFLGRPLTDAETQSLLGQPVEDNADFFETIIAVCGA
jgi:hypothetical protein